MAAIRSKDTTPELMLRKALRAAGHLGYRCHVARLPGKPDIVFGPRRIAIFVDGGFWHGHPKRWKPGRYGVYWDEKIARNQQRDREVDAQLSALGWHVIRVWDFELRRDPEAAVRTVAVALSARVRASA
jgi:DNA mismatch endonuclease (patch repair protein)